MELCTLVGGDPRFFPRNKNNVYKKHEVEIRQKFRNF